MVFNKENFEENRYVRFVMAKNGKENPYLYINKPGELSNSFLDLMKEHEVNFSEEGIVCKDLGFMMIRGGEVIVYDNCVYNTKGRDYFLNYLISIDQNISVKSMNYFEVNKELLEIKEEELDLKFKRKEMFRHKSVSKIALLKYQHNCCADCGQKLEKLELHHKIAKARAGKNDLINEVLLCGSDYNDCHEKWDKQGKDEHSPIIFPGIPFSQFNSEGFRENGYFEFWFDYDTYMRKEKSKKNGNGKNGVIDLALKSGFVPKEASNWDRVVMTRNGLGL